MASIPSETSDRCKTGEDSTRAQEARVRAIALHHALSIEEKRKMQNKVLDTIVTAFDLPTDETTTSAEPTDADARTFRDCLFLFRPSDLDEVVSERNIDNRCGYALCRNSNGARKATRAWDNAGKLVDKQISAKWCSAECKERNGFARRQLSTEPAWLRSSKIHMIRLLTDRTVNDNTIGRQPLLPVEGTSQQTLLASERGDRKANDQDDIPIYEKEVTAAPKPPTYVPAITVGDILEGLPIRTIGTGRSKHGA